MAIPIIDTGMPLKRDGYNDFTRSLIGGILTAAAIASAAYNSKRAIEIAIKEWKLATKYWKIADGWLNYYKDWFAPLEDKELAEAKALKDEEPLYKIAQGRARAAAWMQFKGLTHKAIRQTSRYCTGKRQDIIETLAYAQADALAMSDMLGYRNERAYIETRNNERFKKQLETIKHGRSLPADDVSFGAAAAGIYGQLYNQAWEGLKGAGTYLGYELNREDTAYPSLTLATKPSVEQIVAAVNKQVVTPALKKG